MRKQGVSVVEGTYLTGKSTLAIALVEALLRSSHAIKEHRERLKAEKKIKTYSI